eukprot:CAMPEP_0181300214 /NCGR_PEP_ID=MMETSP1101-20121128/6769_1 /TAXON_ID=46948 /ORGANISM="Rhodomonas abbreviata, Strain Caron Lab Isolate" /LENGTH=90 /DNA_ID=CAMNT_0023405433 /DNA_START=16 /DNA_END=285 /DNA_ORIENTATION=+
MRWKLGQKQALFGLVLIAFSVFVYVSSGPVTGSHGVMLRTGWMSPRDGITLSLSTKQLPFLRRLRGGGRRMDEDEEEDSYDDDDDDDDDD